MPKMHQLLEKPDRWTQEAAFRDKQGNQCLEEHAYSYCLLGALAHCYPFHGEDGPHPLARASHQLQLAASRHGHRSVAQWNDHPSTTHAEILAELISLNI
jgi:hypothetical protein